MTTYVCAIPSNLLGSAQKQEVARAISARHSEATGAPSFFVQVVFHEDATAQRYLGGEPASGHIWIRGDIRAGRTAEQKAVLMQSVVQDVSVISKVPPDMIWMYLCNLEPTDMIEYGHVLPKPGEEAAWFASLSPALQAYLTSLGTTKETFTL